MDSENRKPLTEEEKDEIREALNSAAGKKTAPEPVPVYVERGRTTLPPPEPEELKALALAYAKYLANNDMTPGELTFTDTVPEDSENEDSENKEESEITESAQDDVPEEVPAESEQVPVKVPAEKKKKKPSEGKKKRFEVIEPTEEELSRIADKLEKSQKRRAGAVIIDAHDRLQTGIDAAASGAGRDFITASHRIASTYRQTRRVIGVALLVIGILAALVLAVFDRFTAYEYSYNGKSLGYVRNQEDVTDVLDIAGTMLTENSSGDMEIKFEANQNVTFRQVDARGKSIDTADIAVNKLVYMTDIETEAFGVYDGNSLVAVVKSQEDAESLLEQTRQVLSEPDEGMTLVSSEFTNDLDIRPLNVLLTSVQSNRSAMEMMTEGGSMEIYHIAEEGETLEDLSKNFGVEPVSIFNEDNSETVVEIAQGDKVCIHEVVDPVSVKMVEKGKMKEIIPFVTVKKKSKDYYKGDTYTKQEGADGVQIFEGTITKVSGEVTDRNGTEDVIKKMKKKIILVGTAERPKTAPTGTYAMPIKNYRLSSNFGYRWGRLHSGIDMSAPTGTPIFASDGGTVQRAGWYAGYGLCVEVNHENGRMTRYGHCSKLLVNVGDKVYQGQNIALVGNTGHSFGSHLHFEINLNGSPVNPRPYLGI